MGLIYLKILLKRKNFNDVWLINLEPKGELVWENLTHLIKGEPPAPRHAHTSVRGIKNSYLYLFKKYYFLV